MPDDRYTVNTGRWWREGDEHEDFTAVRDGSLDFNPERGVVTVAITPVDGETMEAEIPVKASGSWNEFVASLPLWTERNDVTGEVDNDDDGSD